MFLSMQNLLQSQIQRFGAIEFEYITDTPEIDTYNDTEINKDNTVFISKNNPLPAPNDIKQFPQIKCSDELVTGLKISLKPSTNGRYHVLYQLHENIGAIVGELVKKDKYTNKYKPADVNDLVSCIQSNEKKNYSINVLFYTNVEEEIINEIQNILMKI